ncbi:MULTISPECIES: hypothetical protein [unclassified Bradyrhizobium]|uniref:hypothetical protein n=1 Tax=unclassified Bradyrhizobium TaxID=2631580 RepID=UPI001FF84500|nr:MULTISPECIES: hypothetical protein [unclassified Bradyrhizobium]MCK1536859.1 hypothetical protein [Bradyrhizobium sp. 176]MCK1560162.1 hypothetical protein [Bradyrhizobium sp. 171]MCK1693708.1 hypothetical protein [Bradyrhizobium sp. 144]
MSQELPTSIILDITRDLNDRVHDQIMMKIAIVDHPKDKFRISLGALSASLGGIAGIFAAAYGLPKSDDMGRELAIEILNLGSKAKTMTADEWKAFAEGRKRK